jgi:N-acetylglucosaminyldiphosphoundecaprenol N-acetyl-beta-D-mannosaminyltransferase
MYPRNQAQTTETHLPQLKTVTIYGVPLLAVNEKQCIKLIMNELESGRGGWCVTIHLSMLRQIIENAEVRKLVEQSTFSIADGISLVWASRLLGTPLPERVCGCDLIYSLTEAAASRGQSIFLIGGNPGTAEKAAQTLKQLYRNLIVAGTYYPPLGFEENPKHLEEIAEYLRSSQPNIVYVALGFPKQEQLIAKLRYICPQAWWIGVGVSFSYVAGEFKRAPRWVQKLGLETFYRVTLEPCRLAKRYLLLNPPFAAWLLISSWFKRFSIDPHSKPTTHNTFNGEIDL